MLGPLDGHRRALIPLTWLIFFHGVGFGREIGAEVLFSGEAVPGRGG